MDKVNLSGRDKYQGRWDGKNFSFERDRSYGFSWPQRNYNCNFCKKEFKSAQALGGHMNVHRRDRAKQLTQHSSSSSSSEINNTTTPHLIQYSNPNPKPNLNHDHKLLLNSPPHASSPKPAAAAAAAPAAPRFFAYNHAVSDQVDALAVSPQIRKKLAVEADSRNEQFKGTMKRDINIDHESRVHKKKNNQLLGFDLNMTSTTDIRHGKDDLDLELRLGSF